MQIVYIVQKTSTNELLGCFANKGLAEKSIELTVSNLKDPLNKELVRNEMTLVPVQVFEQVDHL